MDLRVSFALFIYFLVSLFFLGIFTVGGLGKRNPDLVAKVEAVKTYAPYLYLAMISYLIYTRLRIETQICFGAYRSQFIDLNQNLVPYKVSNKLQFMTDLLLAFEAGFAMVAVHLFRNKYKVVIIKKVK